MKNNILQKKIKAIVAFIQKVVRKTKRKKIVIGWSGGIDSTVALYLLANALTKDDIYVLHLPYSNSLFKELLQITNILGLPKENISEIPIKKTVDVLWNSSNKNFLDKHAQKLRKGNIMARVRMVMLFDFAQHINGLVCGTENRTEHLLGYYTRFGDQASDFEPIVHLFKTEIYKIAAFLKIPKHIIERKPSANLWKGQTDEGEFGFTYHEADKVLKLIVNDNISLKIVIKRFPRAKKIIQRMLDNQFKKEVPYHL